MLQNQGAPTHVEGWSNPHEPTWGLRVRGDYYNAFACWAPLMHCLCRNRVIDLMGSPLKNAAQNSHKTCYGGCHGKYHGNSHGKTDGNSMGILIEFPMRFAMRIPMQFLMHFLIGFPSGFTMGFIKWNVIWILHKEYGSNSHVWRKLLYATHEWHIYDFHINWPARWDNKGAGCVDLTRTRQLGWQSGHRSNVDARSSDLCKLWSFLNHVDAVKTILDSVDTK